MRIQIRSQSGFTLVELMIVVAVIGMLAAVASTSYVRAREETQNKTCVSNLRQIRAAKETWALEKCKSQADSPGKKDLFGTDLYVKSEPHCPAGGGYKIKGMDKNPECDVAGHTL